MGRYDPPEQGVPIDELRNDLLASRMDRIRALPDAQLLALYHELSDDTVIRNVRSLPELEAEIVSRGLSLRSN